MSKPLSRPNEIGRTVGYKVDVTILLERLKQARLEKGGSVKDDQVLLEELSRAADLHTSPPQKPAKRLWVVLKIERGVPVMIDAYRDKRSANARAEFLRLHMEPGLDEVQLLPIDLGKSRTDT